MSSRSRLALHRFAVGLVAATLALIFAGGLVTSTGSGLAVPDWPLSFGQFFPRMVGGVLFEHGHRMVAALVGFLTLVLALLAAWIEPRRAVRRLAYLALAAVVVQGLLGGLTVLWLLPPAVSIAHACLAQGFLCLVVAFAVLTGPGWIAPAAGLPRVPRALATLTALTAGLVYVQVVLGAIMRHLGAGLAIPDFPLAFGTLLPPLGSAAVAIHFAHRVGAVVVTGLVVWTAWRVRAVPALARAAAVAVALVALQVALGALTIWTTKAVLPTTAHVAGGAALLAATLVCALRARRRAAPRAVRTRGLLTPERAAA